MTPEQFTYWLQGMLESRAKGTALGVKEVDMIREHLKTVFIKEWEKEFDRKFELPKDKTFLTLTKEDIPADSFYTLEDGVLDARPRLKGFIHSLLTSRKEALVRGLEELRIKEAEDSEGMCRNCCTPWKCNGPHISNPDEFNQALDEAIQLIRSSREG